jgi:hypothetical protein
MGGEARARVSIPCDVICCFYCTHLGAEDSALCGVKGEGGSGWLCARGES